MRTSFLSTVLSAITLWSLPGIVSAQNDQLYIQGGSSISGKVVGVTSVAVSFDVRGSQRDVKVNEIRRLEFAEDPTDLASGRGKILAGKIASGYNDLKRVDPGSIEREIVRADLQYYLAFCQGKLALTLGGDKAKASEAMLAFVRSNPNSYHFFEAAELLGDLAVSSQDYANAVKYYGSIASRAPFPEYKMRASIAEAQALVAQGDFANAEAKFDVVIADPSQTTESRRQKRLASVGKARCIAETGTPAQGLQLIEKIIDENDSTDSELFGRAYNAQGDCYRKADKPKEALMAYLHVDILFYSDPEIHAEALYHLSKLWEAAKQADRAVAARRLLDDRYAGSVWSQKP